MLAAAVAHPQPLLGPQAARAARGVAERAVTKRQSGLLGPLIPAVAVAAAQTMEHPHLLVGQADLVWSSCPCQP